MAVGTGLAIAGVVTSAIGVISGFLGASKAESRAKKAAKEEARLEGAVTGEKLRQLGIEEEVTEGQTIAQYAGSGVKAVNAQDMRVGAGSPMDVMQASQREFGFQRDVVSEVGATKAAQALTRGSMVGDAYRFQGYTQAAQGISSIFNILHGLRSTKAPTSP